MAGLTCRYADLRLSSLVIASRARARRRSLESAPDPAVRAHPAPDSVPRHTRAAHLQLVLGASDANNGLTPDRWPTKSFSSIAAVGFALTAYPVGVERGYVSRADAAQRTLNTLRFMYNAPQGAQATDVTGYKGFFYHFLDMQTGFRFQQVELSTIDTSLLLAGVLFCQSYFTGADATESAIRAYADSLYLRIDWAWAVHNAAASSAWAGTRRPASSIPTGTDTTRG